LPSSRNGDPPITERGRWSKERKDGGTRTPGSQ
jgi:hypothetical protein